MKLFSMVNIAILFSLSSCGRDVEEAGDPDASIETDTDADTDTDSDTDTDTDTDADAGDDAGEPTYWNWNRTELPSAPSGICDGYCDLRVVALSDTDVVVCAGRGESGNGIAEFDGVEFTSMPNPLGFEVFECDGLFSDGSTVWTWGYGDWEYKGYHLLQRVDGVWVEESVEGLENCPTASEGCAIQAMYVDASGLPHAIGWTDAPSTDERSVWVRSDATGAWTLDDRVGRRYGQRVPGRRG
jgi:hypothetical protein